jgi:hypothetical protein
MRITFRLILIALILTGAVCPAPPQEAGKIVEQCVKAAGGSKALSKVQTLTLEGTFTGADGKAGTYTLDTKLPNRYYMELLVDDKSLIEAYNGKSAWHQTAAGELGTLVGPEGMQLEAAAQYYNSHLLNPKKSKMTVTFAGPAQVRGKDTLQLELTTATGMKRQVFFDPQTHLIVKEAATVGGVEEEVLFDDYRAVDGVKLPYKIELHRDTRGGQRNRRRTDFRFPQEITSAVARPQGAFQGNRRKPESYRQNPGELCRLAIRRRNGVRGRRASEKTGTQ